MGYAIVNFNVTDQLLLEPQIEFSCFWNTRWLSNEEYPQTDHDAVGSNRNVNPIKYSLLIWNKFTGDKMTKSESVGVIVSYASYSSHENRLFIYFISKGERKENVNLIIPNEAAAKTIQYWEYFSRDDKDMTLIQQQERVEGLEFDLKKYSITVVEYLLQKIHISFPNLLIAEYLVARGKVYKF